MAVNVLDYIENELLACLCSMLRDEGRPACECHHFGGEVPPVGDRCSANSSGENGQVWVRRVAQAIDADADRITFAGVPCDASWQAEIELGVYRCISAVPDEHGNAPAAAAYDADRELLAADRATLARVLCCWPLAGTAPQELPFEVSVSVLGSQIVPTGPSGACAGSIMTIVVATELTVEEDDDADDEEDEAPVFISQPAGGG